MNQKKCKAIRGFVRSTFSTLQQCAYVVGSNNVTRTIDEKGDISQFEYTGTVRLDPNSQKGQYRKIKGLNINWR